MHTKEKVAALSLAGMLAFMFAFPIGSAFASPPMNISFQASSGNAAGWVTHGTEAYLTVNTPGYSYALITLHHFSATLPSTQPSFYSAQYASGTPRIFIYMSDGNYVFIYGDATVETIINGVGTYPASYSSFVTSEGSTPVSAVYIVADTSQAIPYTAYVTSFVYNGVTLIGS